MYFAVCQYASSAGSRVNDNLHGWAGTKPAALVPVNNNATSQSIAVVLHPPGTPIGFELSEFLRYVKRLGVDEQGIAKGTHRTSVLESSFPDLRLSVAKGSDFIGYVSKVKNIITRDRIESN